MRKHRIEYASPLDAFTAVVRRLGRYEQQHHLSSEDFYDQYSKGLLDDTAEFIEWANNYRHYIALKLSLEASLNRVA